MRVGVAECRSGSRETYRVSRGNEKVCLKVGVALARPATESSPTAAHINHQPNVVAEASPLSERADFN
jgi:hypothetical protein